MPEAKPTGYMTLWEHLEELRKVILRIVIAIAVAGVLVFCFKDWTFRILLAPKEWDFVTYRALERLMLWVHYDFHFEPYHVRLISTDLSAQFMMHVTASFVLGALVVSPYIIYQLFSFVAPALYTNERRYAVPILGTMYALFVIGVLMNYFVLFPIAFRFLGTYQVSPEIENTITLESYVTTFASLTLVMGLVFQLPVLMWILSRVGLVSASLLKTYRRHALVAIMVVSAIITPPDIFTLILVTIPLYGLYELSIRVIR